MEHIKQTIPFFVFLVVAVALAINAAYWKGRTDALKDWKELLMPLLDRLHELENGKCEEKKDDDRPVVH